jgi:inhibitor of cysteine peptidase
VVVSLDENATTGHRWEVEKNGAPALRPAGDDVSAPGAAPGAGARRSFVFQAVAPGRGEIRIVLRRAWEDGVPPHRIFTASFEVAG